MSLAKSLVSTCLLVLLHLAATAQQYQAAYRFSHMIDTVNRYTKTEEMWLFFTPEKSLYISYAKRQADSAMAADPEGYLRSGVFKTGNPERIFYHHSAQEAKVVFPLVGDTLLVEETMSKISWELLPSEKMIAGMNCKLAVGSFRGRVYQAWYAPEVPVAAGPWKLQGLPGLIVEAADQSGTVRFDFMGMKQDKGPECICLPAKGTPISKADWAARREAIRKNPQLLVDQAMKAQPAPVLPPGYSGSVQMSVSRTPQAVNNMRRNTPNNPIELVPE